MSENKYSKRHGAAVLTNRSRSASKQANGAVLVRYGDTVVLSAAVASKEAKIQTFPINDQL